MVISEPFLNEPINLGGRVVLLFPLLSKKGKFLNALDNGGTEASDFAHTYLKATSNLVVLYNAIDLLVSFYNPD